MKTIEKKARAMSGISTLIIFIALILVAAVAALVLLQTIGSLQSQAVATGKESKTQVSTQLQVLAVQGRVNIDTNNDLNYVVITAKLAPGSDKIRLSNLLLSVKDGNGDFFRAGIDYNQATTNNPDTNGSSNCTNGSPPPSCESGSVLQGSKISASGAASATKYSVRWLTTVPSQKIAVSEGDLIEIYYYTNNLVSTNEKMTVELVPTGGTGSRIELKTPIAFNKTFEQLFP